jgi:hypothetical protein
MARHNNIQLPSNEGNIQLAISSLNARQLQSNRRAAAIFNVPETTRWEACLTRLPAQLKEAHPARRGGNSLLCT